MDQWSMIYEIASESGSVWRSNGAMVCEWVSEWPGMPLTIGTGTVSSQPPHKDDNSMTAAGNS